MISIQTYRNPFDRPLEIHYAIPVDPTFALTNLEVHYQNTVVEGLIKEKEVVKV